MKKRFSMLAIALVFVASFGWAKSVETEAENLPGMIVAPTVNDTDLEYIGNIMREHISKYMLLSKRFRIVNRDDLGKILEEQELNLTGVVDPDKALEVGKVLSAAYMIVPRLMNYSYKTREDHETSSSTNYTTKKGKDGRSVSIVKSYEITKRRFFVHTVELRGAFKMTDLEEGEVLYQKDIVVDAIERDEIYREVVTYTPQGKVVGTNVEKGEPRTKDRVISLMLEEKLAKVSAALLKAIPFKGRIIQTQGKDIVLNMGESTGLRNRVNVEVFPRGKKRVYGSEGQTVLQVKEIYDDYSIATVCKGDLSAITGGDSFKVIDPIFRMDAATMSFLLPGLGQLANGFVGRGIGALAVAGGLEAWMIVEIVQANKQGWLNPTATNDSSGTPLNVTGQANHTALFYLSAALFAIAHSWNVIDAGFLAEVYDPGLSFNVAVSHEDFRLGLSYRF